MLYLGCAGDQERTDGGRELAAEPGGHRLINITSHVVSFEGSVGAIGLCSCGELISAEGFRTHDATKELRDAWRSHFNAALNHDPANGDPSL